MSKGSATKLRAMAGLFLPMVAWVLNILGMGLGLAVVAVSAIAGAFAEPAPLVKTDARAGVVSTASAVAATMRQHERLIAPATAKISSRQTRLRLVQADDVGAALCGEVWQEDYEAWRTARQKDTVEAYQRYLKACAKVKETMSERCLRDVCVFAKLARQRMKWLQMMARPQQLQQEQSAPALAAAGWQLMPQVGHADSVRSVAFSPDGRLLATGSDDTTVRLWEVSSGRLLRTLKGHEGWVASVAFSPDGRLLATGSDDTTVRLWEVSSGELRRTLQGHAAIMWSVAFSPDGRLLASGSLDNVVRLWEVGSGKLLRTLRTLRGYVAPWFLWPSIPMGAC